MAKIIPLTTEANSKWQWTEDVIEGIVAADNIVVALKMPDGSVQTAYWNADFGTKAEIKGHIEADIIDQMILANIGGRY